MMYKDNNTVYTYQYHIMPRIFMDFINHFKIVFMNYCVSKSILSMQTVQFQLFMKGLNYFNAK